MEGVRRASLVEEEARQIRVEELDVGEFISRTVEIAGGTTDSVVVDEDTTERIQTTEVVGSAEPDPPAC